VPGFDARSTLADLVALVATRIGELPPDEVNEDSEPRSLLGRVAEEHGLIGRISELCRLLDRTYAKISGGGVLPAHHRVEMWTNGEYLAMLQLVEELLRGPSLRPPPPNPFLARHFLNQGRWHDNAWVVRDPIGWLSVTYQLDHYQVVGSEVRSGGDKTIGGHVVGYVVARYSDLTTQDVAAVIHAIAAGIETVAG